MRSASFSIGWILKVTIAAIIGIVALKWLFTKINVPGLSTFVKAA